MASPQDTLPSSSYRLGVTAARLDAPAEGGWAGAAAGPGAGGLYPEVWEGGG